MMFRNDEAVDRLLPSVFRAGGTNVPKVGEA
jgi:hypothetical protein